MMALGISNICIINVKGTDYHCMVFNIDKTKAHFRLNNFVLNYKGYL